MFFGLFMRYRKFLVIDSDEGNMPLGLVVGSRVLAVRFWKLGTFNHSQIMAKLSDCLPNYVCFSKNFTFEDLGLILWYFKLTSLLISFVSFTFVTRREIRPTFETSKIWRKVRVDNFRVIINMELKKRAFTLARERPENVWLLSRSSGVRTDWFAL